jgi:phosphatidylserine/phosphatidylglycerophosphate/cardiolipin synthase-like enzyme
VLDLLGVALPDRNCKLESKNQPFKKGLNGVGTPRLARGDKLHHKFAVIDNKKVITGSFNWSPSAAHTNDETLLVIHSPNSLNTSPEKWIASGTPLSLGSHRTFKESSIVNGSDAGMGWRGVKERTFFDESII